MTRRTGCDDDARREHETDGGVERCEKSRQGDRPRGFVLEPRARRLAGVFEAGQNRASGRGTVGSQAMPEAHFAVDGPAHCRDPRLPIVWRDSRWAAARAGQAIDGHVDGANEFDGSRGANDGYWRVRFRQTVAKNPFLRYTHSPVPEPPSTPNAFIIGLRSSQDKYSVHVILAVFCTKGRFGPPRGVPA